MKRIALATCGEVRELTADDRLLVESLRESGFDAEPLVWDEPGQHLGDFAAVVIRSCWDYHKKPVEFLAWLNRLETTGVKVLNAPAVLRWNLDKMYLCELAERGVKIPPTVWFGKGEKGRLSDILAANGWRTAVLKPTVSATAWRTFLVTPENADDVQTEFESLLFNGGTMVQQFVEEVLAKGEWSFIFFDKRFSHAVLKRANAGDFRVQNNFGGSVETSVEPATALVEEARRIVQSVAEDLTYARVDGVEIAGELYLMELELIEPVLYLEQHVRAAQRFAAAIVSRFEFKKGKFSS